MTTTNLTAPHSPATFGVARTCYRHSDTGSTQVCQQCRRNICEGCVSVGAGYDMARVVCTACADAGRTRARAVTAASVSVAAAVVIGAVAFVASRPAPIEYSVERRFEIERLSALQAQTPCAGQTTLDLVDLLNKERDHRRVVALVDAFRAGCDAVPRLYWESYAARMQLQDYAGAAADAGRLIDDDPDDGDFWFWRASARKKGGDVAGAEADLRRSAEISGKGAFWSVIDLADLLEEQKRGCEAVPLLATIASNNPAQAERVDVNARLSRLVRETPCPDPLAGRRDTGALSGAYRPVPPLCATLPRRLIVDDGGHAAAGLELTLANLFDARTRTVAHGPAVSCRAEAAKNWSWTNTNSPSPRESWSGRLICSGLPSATATATGPSDLQAQEVLASWLLDDAIRQWCVQP